MANQSDNSDIKLELKQLDRSMERRKREKLETENQENSPNLQEKGGTPTPLPPNLQEKEEKLTPLSPNLQEKEGTPTPLPLHRKIKVLFATIAVLLSGQEGGARAAFEIESELEQLRLSVRLQKRQNLEAEKQENLPNFQEKGKQETPLPLRQKRKVAFATLAVLLLGTGGGAIAAFKAQNWAFDSAEKIITDVENVSKTSDIDSLNEIRKSVKRAIAVLEKIPNLPGFEYQKAQTELLKLRSLQQSVDRNLKAAEHFKVAETLAMEAAILVKNPPHPVQIWKQAREKWQEAIARLESIPLTATVGQNAQQKLASYRNNYAVISQRVAIAQKAIDFSNRGVAEIDKGDYQRAIQFFNQAINLNASQPEAYVGRGIAYSELGNNQTAIQEYDTAIKLNPNLSKAYYNRGLSYFELTQNQKALEDYGRAIEINPNYAKAYLERGGVRYQLGSPQESMADFQKAAQLFSTQGDTQNHELAQGIIQYLEANSGDNSDAVNYSESQRCGKTESNLCDDIYLYVTPSKRNHSGTANVQDDNNDGTSIRTPSHSRGGSFQRKSRRRR